MTSDRNTRAHLNLVDATRQLYRLDPGAEIDSDERWLFGAGSHPHSAITNAAFRADDAIAGGELVARAREFFAARGRGFSLWARGDEPADRDLVEAAAEAEMEQVYEMPAMVIGRRVEERALPAGVEIRRVASEQRVAEYWSLTARAYVSLGFPPQVFDQYSDRAGLLADNVVAFLAHLDGRPVSAAMTIVSRRVAGVYWVGTAEEARGKGLGWATTAAATNAGFELGADMASLQASPMGEPIYRRMGFETIHWYLLLMSPAPT